jgi:hypothetical protein
VFFLLPAVLPVSSQGSLLHGGVDIEKGTRFLMILFAHLSYD